MEFTRRGFMASGAAGLAASTLGSTACASQAAQQTAAPRGRMLLKGGCVLTLDPTISY